MAERHRKRDHDGAAVDRGELNTVFVDTNFGTHIAILVCSSDTVSDFKEKVAVEHKQCFPEIGGIQVHSVKVKRRSDYYHLPDIMFVWRAFDGVKRNWFLSVTASNVPICVSTSSSMELGTSSGVKINMTDIHDDCKGFISDGNRKGIILSMPDYAAPKNAVSEIITKPKADKTVEKTTDSHRSIYLEEHCMGTKSPVKKKRKLRHTKDVSHNSGLEGGDAMFRPNGKDVKPNMSDSIVKVSDPMNDQYDVEGRLLSDGTYLPNVAEKGNLGSILDSQNLNGSDRPKEDNGFESVVDGLGEDVHQLGVVSILVPGSSAGMRDASGGGRDVNTTGKKRKKREVEKTAANIQDRTDMEQIGKGERTKPITDKMEEGMGLSSEHDHEVLMPSNSKAPDHVIPELSLKEANLLQDAEKSNVGIQNSHKCLDSDERKEDNALESKIDYEGKDVPSVHSGGFCTNISDPYATLMGADGGTGDAKSDGKRRKKKKVHKTAKVQHTSDVAQTEIGEMKKPHTETTRLEEKGASLEHDNEVIMPADSKAPDHVDPDLALKEASIMWDADAVTEPEISSCIKKRKKKKREKNSAGTNIEDSGIKDILNGTPSGDHITKEIGKGESTRLNEGMDVEMRLLDASNHDAQEKVWDVNRKEADLVETQAERTSEEVSVRNEMMTGKTKNFPDVCHAAFPTAKTGNTIMKSNQADKDDENTENKSRKATKKRKKQKHTATDVQENLPVKDQQIGVEPLATKETSFGFANSELEGRYVESSKVLSCKSVEKVDENYELVLNTNGVKENAENGGEGINFKQYFVADQLQNQVDMSNKVRNTTKLKSSKAKDNDLPSINISTELQKSVKSFENKKADNNSCEEDTAISVRDSEPKTDRNEMSPTSFKRSSKAAEKGVKTSSPSELREMSRQKPDDIVAPSSYHKKNPSLDKSSSERSQTLHNNNENERLLLGPNLKNMMPMKTLKKKILLAKLGTIFQDNSGESSGDENETVHSDDHTLSASDSSSMSGGSAWESEVSRNSTSNGSSAAKGKSMPKLEENLTMDVILRSSKRYKKAKEVASQSETQPIEFVPDGQPV